MDVAILYRNIQKEYQTLFGNALTENTLPTNETGLYAGVVLRPAYGWQLSAYADLFQFPWLRYRVDAPSSGRDYLVQIDYQPDKQSEIYLLYRNKNKPVNESGLISAYPLDNLRQSLRLHFVKQITPSFSLKGRTENALV